MKKRTAYSICRGTVVLYVIAIIIVCYAVKNREIRVISRNDALGSDTLLAISNEEVIDAKKGCRCAFSCMCVNKYAHRMVGKILGGNQKVDVLIYLPHEIDTIFKYGITSSVYPVENAKSCVWNRNTSLYKVLRVLEYIIAENSKSAVRGIDGLAPIPSYFFASTLLILAWAPLLYHRERFPFYGYLLNIGNSRKELVILDI